MASCWFRLSLWQAENTAKIVPDLTHERPNRTPRATKFGQRRRRSERKILNGQSGRVSSSGHVGQSLVRDSHSAGLLPGRMARHPLSLHAAWFSTGNVDRGPAIDETRVISTNEQVLTRNHNSHLADFNSSCPTRPLAVRYFNVEGRLDCASERSR